MSNGVLGSQTVDRKLDLLVKELRRYRVSVAGLVLTYGLLMGTHFCTLGDPCRVRRRDP